MYDSRTLEEQFSVAGAFFAQTSEPVRYRSLGEQTVANMLAAVPPASDLTNQSGLFSVIDLSAEVVDPQAQKQLNEASDLMISLAGLGTSYCQKQAAAKNDPSLLFDTALWKQVLTHVPLLGPFSFVSTGYKKQIVGASISTEFLEQILDFAVAGPVVGAFRAFIQSFGSTISAKVASTGKPFHYAANAIYIDAQKVGSAWKILPHLKMYFVDFTSNNTQFISSCASAQKVDVDLSYITVDTIWDYGLYKRDANVSAAFDALVGNVAVDNIKNSQNFFSGTV